MARVSFSGQLRAMPLLSMQPKRKSQLLTRTVLPCKTCAVFFMLVSTTLASLLFISTLDNTTINANAVLYNSAPFVNASGVPKDEPLGGTGSRRLSKANSRPPTKIPNKATITSSSRPQGLRVVFMGDSIMRYQYLSLVYFARYGVWFDPSNKTHHLVQEKASGFDTWLGFYQHTNELLQPYELCDCYRLERTEGKRENYNSTVENRYYYDPINDNLLVYVTAFGNENDLHGHWTAEDVTNSLLVGRNGTTKLPQWKKPDRSKQQPPLSFRWSTRDWTWVIRHHLAQIRPKPSHVVLNAGLWANDFNYDNDKRKGLIQSVANNGMKPIWRTTTYNFRHGLFRKHKRNDHFLCPQKKQQQQQPQQPPTPQEQEPEPHSCLDVSWTKELDSRWYWDRVHMYEPIYRIMNEELLEDHLGYQFSQNYTRVNRTDFKSDA